MGLTPMGDFTFNHVDNVDKPNKSATQNKTDWDSRGAELKTALNNAIAKLNAVTDGASGADNVAMTPITETGSAATVQAIVEALITKLKAVTDGGSGADLIGMTVITETGANATVQSVIEALITRLKATADSASGADLIGATAISEVTGTTLQAQIESLKTLLGTLANLTTTEKTNMVGAVNEHLAKTVQQEGGVHGLEIEEGTWTPVVKGATTTGEGTYTNQAGVYKKIGKMVHIRMLVTITAHTGTGDMYIDGLPFTPNANFGLSIGAAHNITLTTNHILTIQTFNGIPTIAFLSYPIGGGAAVNVQIDTSFQVIISGMYFIN